MSRNSSTIWLPRSRRSSAIARQRVAVLLSSTPQGERFLDSGLLLASELVTNAVLHGTPVGRLIYLALDVDPDRLRIEVHDARGDRRPALAASGLDDETGRGLRIVESLAARWGCCPRRPLGKIVWCEVAA
ncbi:ATP-binding protein [Kitasatospora sp. SUK 42]|uniref:ATP-binding protein n=1 Tax=Kitasatospora sp. SUK 42 TaxID=1588882 RepID=UPI0018CAB198|nr:ATP-binding protein [Kitasatospora sp. SUK 42]MBV2153470.1 ATP-binding protein [Kitasatospora sp. SUK 42]